MWSHRNNDLLGKDGNVGAISDDRFTKNATADYIHRIDVPARRTPVRSFVHVRLMICLSSCILSIGLCGFAALSKFRTIDIAVYFNRITLWAPTHTHTIPQPCKWIIWTFDCVTELTTSFARINSKPKVQICKPVVLCVCIPVWSNTMRRICGSDIYTRIKRKGSNT